MPAPRPASISPSRSSYPEQRTKASLGLRVCLVLLGVCVVLGTAGAIIISASDDPPRAATPTPTATTAAPALPAPPVPVTVAEPAPVPPPVAPPAVTSTAKPGASAKTKPASSAPPGVKGAKVPPNPFGGGPLPGKRK